MLLARSFVVLYGLLVYLFVWLFVRSFALLFVCLLVCSRVCSLDPLHYCFLARLRIDRDVVLFVIVIVCHCYCLSLSFFVIVIFRHCHFLSLSFFVVVIFHCHFSLSSFFVIDILLSLSCYHRINRKIGKMTKKNKRTCKIRYAYFTSSFVFLRVFEITIIFPI